MLFWNIIDPDNNNFDILNDLNNCTYYDVDSFYLIL